MTDPSESTEPMTPRPAGAKPSLQLGARLGGYALERLIGRGGMGAVYLGVSEAGVRRAIKLPFLDQDRSGLVRARFQREAEVLARIPPHRGVVRVHAASIEDDNAYCVLELVEGRSLEAILKKDGPLPVARVLEIGEQVARALDHLHRNGVIHRDVKPGNVLIRDEDGSAVVTDFGLVRDEAATGALTTTGTFVGTPLYVAPEQALATGPIDGRADVYALGATLYALLTGHAPHRAPTLAELMRLLVTERPVPPSAERAEVPPAVDAVILRALERDPRSRHPTALALAEELAAVRAGRAVSTSPTAAWLAAGAVLACVALLSLVLLFATSASSGPEGTEGTTRIAADRAAFEGLAAAVGSEARPDGKKVADLVWRAEMSLGAIARRADPEAVAWHASATERLRWLKPLAVALDHARAGQADEACAALVPLGAASGTLVERVTALASRLVGPAKDSALLLVRLRVCAYALLPATALPPVRNEAVGFVQRVLATRPELGLELVADLLLAAPRSESAVDLLLLLDERSLVLTSRELGGRRLSPGFRALSNAALARGDSPRAARFFERVLRQDPLAAPSDELEAAILRRSTEAVTERDAPKCIDAIRDKLKIGRVAHSPGWVNEQHALFEERIARDPEDWAARLTYADALEKTSRQEHRLRAVSLARAIARDGALPAIASARASLILAGHLLAMSDYAGAIAAASSAHALGHHEPDECSHLASQAHRRAFLASDPSGSIDEAVRLARRAVVEGDDRVARTAEHTLTAGRFGMPPLAPVDDRDQHELPFERRNSLVVVLLAVPDDADLVEAGRVCDEARQLVESGAVTKPWRLLRAKVEYARGQNEVADRLVDETFARDAHDREWLLRELESNAFDLDEAGRSMAAARARHKLAAMRAGPPR